MGVRPNASRHAPQCSRRSAFFIGAICGTSLLAACSESKPDDPPGLSDGAGASGGTGLSGVADVPDAEALLATLTATREVLTACSAVADTTSERLERIRAVIEEQRDVLVRLIDAEGLNRDDEASVPTARGEDAASTGDPKGGRNTTPSTDSLSEAEAEMTVATLLAEQSTGVTIVETLVPVSATNLPTLMALHGQRAAAAQILGAPVTWPGIEGPLGPAATTVLAGLRQAVYGFEVLASRSSEKERDAYRDALEPLREASRTVTELAGPAAPVAPLGYGLPSDVGDREGRRQLATDLLAALAQAVIAGSAARAGDEDAIAGTLRLMSLAVRLGTSFRVPAAPFPGLTVPAA